MTAIVIGNGTSRKSIDLHSLQNYTTYGCNKLYIDYNPDYLIAVDKVMVDEFVKNKVDETHNVYTTFYIQMPGKLNYFTKHTGYNSGHTCCWLASQHKHKTVYMLGFDYIGINGKLNNVYADTVNYKRSTDDEVPYSKWYVELSQLLDECVDTQFIRIVGNDHYLPITNSNYTEITLEQFKEQNK